ncbi:hypothetical protein Droror1_Dr00001605 [Drosera rotundifolia]
MVGAIPIVGSSRIIDSLPACSCISVEALSSSCVKNGIDNSRSLMGRKQSTNVSCLYGGRGGVRVGVVGRSCSRRPKKGRGLVVVSELAGQYEDSFEDVKTNIFNYFTYKAVRTVLNQLYEMNPVQYRWFYEYVATHNSADGKRFIRNLGKEKQELAERVMVTRLHLYGKWIKKCNHAEMYQEISDENLELMRERLMETIIWPTDDTNTIEKIG